MRRRQMLEVVEHEQHLSLAQKLDDLIQRLVATGQFDADLTRDPAANSLNEEISSSATNAAPSEKRGANS